MLILIDTSKIAYFSKYYKKCSTHILKGTKKL